MRSSGERPTVPAIAVCGAERGVGKTPAMGTLGTLGTQAPPVRPLVVVPGGLR
jgi:hypothetical protein